MPVLSPLSLAFTLTQLSSNSSSAHCSCAEELFIATASRFIVRGNWLLIPLCFLHPPPCCWISWDIFLHSAAPGQHLLAIYNRPAFAAPFCLSFFPPVGRLASGTSKAPGSCRSFCALARFLAARSDTKRRGRAKRGEVRAWNSSAMRPDARLDSVVFQLTPTRTRWEHPIDLLMKRLSFGGSFVPWVLVSGMVARTYFYEYFSVTKFGLCDGSCAVHFAVWYLEASIWRTVLFTALS